MGCPLVDASAESVRVDDQAFHSVVMLLGSLAIMAALHDVLRAIALGEDPLEAHVQDLVDELSSRSRLIVVGFLDRVAAAMEREAR